MNAAALLRARWAALARRQQLLWFAGLLALLVLSIALVALLRAQVSEARAQAQQARLSLQMAADIEQVQRLEATLTEAVSTLLAQAEARGMRAGHWGERRINIRQSNLSRDDVNKLLRDITVNDDRLFSSDEFELSVLRPDEGLFSTPPQDSALRLTLRGSVLFRLGGQ